MSLNRPPLSRNMPPPCDREIRNLFGNAIMPREFCRKRTRYHVPREARTPVSVFAKTPDFSATVTGTQVGCTEVLEEFRDEQRVQQNAVLVMPRCRSLPTLVEPQGCDR
jgi:hypothetical protein